MPLRLIDPKTPVRWVHPLERAEDGTPLPGATVFHLLPLTEGASRRIDVSLDIDKLGRKSAALNEYFSALFKQCVVRIDNVQLPGAAELTSLTNPDDIVSFWEMVPSEYARAIYVAIQNLKELDEGTVKN